MENTSEHALVMGLKALTYVVARDPLTQALMTTTGIGADDIRGQAQDPAFLGAVVDFLLARETDLLDFCAEEHYKPDSIVRLRAEMPGGLADVWT